MQRPNALKAKLLAGKPAFGTINAAGSPVIAEMMGLAGYDFVLVDGEHGIGDRTTHLSCLHAIMSSRATALYRVPENTPLAIKQALDMGAEGVVVPNVRDGAAAAQLVDSCHYPPAGRRGAAARLVRASDYGFGIDLHMAGHGGGDLFVCAMIESASAVEDIEAIAATPGIDALLIGHNDLAGDLGVPGQFTHPVYRTAVKRIEHAARSHGRILGGSQSPTEPIPDLVARGYLFITNGSDVGFLREGLRADLRAAYGGVG